MQVLIINSFGALLCVVAASFVYLSTPNQQWLARPFAKPKTLWLYAGLALVWAWYIFTWHMSGLSSFFSVLTLQMLLLGTLPFLTRFALPPAPEQKVQSSIEKHSLSSAYQPRWWLRLLGSFVLSFPLAVGLAGLFAMFSSGDMTDTVKSQFVMWLITPLCLSVMAFAFFHRSAVSWLIKLSLANVGVFSLLVWGQLALSQ